MFEELININLEYEKYLKEEKNIYQKNEKKWTN